MIIRTLEQIQKMIRNAELGGEATLTIHGVSINDKDELTGKLFIPIKGERFNGHDFVKGAIEKGAVAALWNKNEPNYPKDVPLIFVDDTLEALQQLSESYRDELDIKIVGVTGSNGKTSTKDMVYAVLSTVFAVQKTEGNYNNHLGLPLTILRTAEDTDVLVLEMGMSSRGEIELLSKLSKPDVAIITNIGEAHLQDLGSRDEIAEAKLEITAGLKDNGTLVYVGDEPLLQDRIHRYTNVKLVPFGQDEVNEYYPVLVKQEKNGTSFTTNKGSKEIFIPVLGRHNVYNALAAIAVGQLFNLSWDDMIKGLSQLKITQMRSEIIPGKNGSTVINDAYNASPTSMKAAIQLIQELEGYNRRILVLGDMLELGDLEEQFHKDTGAAIDPTKVELVYTFGERGTWIAEGAKHNFSEENVHSFLDKADLISHLSAQLKNQDVVLVKASRGMKLEEVVTGLKE
ncbi:UDP-N-acetylmuramoyl-tripeptide--D-alanyl-D-alanine ligase [Bacillus suaedaesalsae]|uniref:UDP-N-acetylmuramoyl-tripeptide--D-alanyl-D-alanine ligase n=1 Tax=Bacillus suaedaesalsae TaxID=2810349 RepID=A0ABS2DGX3_9BACI|nr:UDP-N-acetylmuramoyl-tripeptide--D-alanyl-D-alanine ligase [Bacillus suaedaesalsae]MBM6617710.1 UDP-N-acetylmuramoyl-tripeptide--D-alanyl-D-alanine ligase [Bacillus suaedaesalsae]